MISKILAEKDTFFTERYVSHFTNSYCAQNNFNILFSGGTERMMYTSPFCNLKLVDPTALDDLKILKSAVIRRWGSRAVCLKGDVFFLGGVSPDYQVSLPIEKYSLASHEYQKVSEMPDDRGFYCAFINKI